MTETTPAYHYPVLDKGYVELADLQEDVLGSDRKVVNAARVSFSKKITQLAEADKKLIGYLGNHDHTSPFRHCALSFRIKAPLFVFAQWRTHMVASALQGEIHSFNETSGRYVELKEEFYFPASYRSQSKSNRQASGPDLPNQVEVESLYRNSVDTSYNYYRDLIGCGLAREQARAVLPQALYTELMWTASLQAIANFIILRSSEHAQEEIRIYAHAVHDIASQVFPNALAALVAPKPPTIAQLDLLSESELSEYLRKRTSHVLEMEA